jgi:hypothetical protein
MLQQARRLGLRPHCCPTMPNRTQFLPILEYLPYRKRDETPF